MPSSHLILCRPFLLLPPSGSFPMSQLFEWGGQSTGVSASTSVLPMDTQDWSPLGWTGWISLQSKGLSRAFSNTTAQKHQFFGAQLSSQSSPHIHTWPLGKPQLSYWNDNISFLSGDQMNDSRFVACSTSTCRRVIPMKPQTHKYKKGNRECVQAWVTYLAWTISRYERSHKYILPSRYTAPFLLPPVPRQSFTFKCQAVAMMSSTPNRCIWVYPGKESRIVRVTLQIWGVGATSCCSRGSQALLPTAHLSSSNGPLTMGAATAAQWLFLGISYSPNWAL